MRIVDKGLILDSNTVAVESWEHVNSEALHKLVPIDDILADHVQKVAQVGRPVGERWTRVHHPSFLAGLPPVILIVVQLVSH